MQAKQDAQKIRYLQRTGGESMTCPLCDTRMKKKETTGPERKVGTLACAGCGFQLFFKGLKGFTQLPL